MPDDEIRLIIVLGGLRKMIVQRRFRRMQKNWAQHQAEKEILHPNIGQDGYQASAQRIPSQCKIEVNLLIIS